MERRSQVRRRKSDPILWRKYLGWIALSGTAEDVETFIEEQRRFRSCQRELVARVHDCTAVSVAITPERCGRDTRVGWGRERPGRAIDVGCVDGRGPERRNKRPAFGARVQRVVVERAARGHRSAPPISRSAFPGRRSARVHVVLTGVSRGSGQRKREACRKRRRLEDPSCHSIRMSVRRASCPPSELSHSADTVASRASAACCAADVCDSHGIYAAGLGTCRQRQR